MADRHALAVALGGIAARLVFAGTGEGAVTMRIRSVKPEFWASFSMAKLSEPALILALGLMNHACDRGFFEADPRMIKAAIFPLRELSGSIPGCLQELSRTRYIEVRQAHDGRLIGQIVNFTKHQVINKPSKFISKACSDFANATPANEFVAQEAQPPLALKDDSGSPTVVLPEPSGKIPLGTGNRDQGIGSGSVEQGGARAGSEEKPLVVLSDQQRREVDRLPEELKTPAFIAAWEKWMIYCGERFNGGKAMTLHSADAHLKICLAFGPVDGVTAIENAISKQLREPAMPFASKSGQRTGTTKEQHANGF